MMHEAFNLIKLEVVTNVHALIDVRVYRQACIYHINHNKDEVTTQWSENSKDSRIRT